MISAALVNLFFALASLQTEADSESVYWQELGLKDQDLVTFERLKSAPGLVSSTIADDPILVLGVFSQSDDARSRFARLYLRRELDRAERELAFFRAYSEIYAEEIGQTPLIDLSTFSVQRGADTPSSRLVLVVETDCAPCDQLVDWIELSAHRRQIAGADLYFPQESDPDGVQAWARAVSLDRTLVSEGRLTLNVGAPIDSPSIETSAPQIFWRRGNELQPLTMSERLKLGSP